MKRWGRERGNALGSNAEMNRDTGDEGDELLGSLNPDTDVPARDPARRLKGPGKRGSARQPRYLARAKERLEREWDFTSRGTPRYSQSALWRHRLQRS